MDFKDKIRIRRRQLGLNVDQLAELIGKDRSTIYRYENGDISDVPISALVPLAKALDVKESWLLDDGSGFENLGHTSSREEAVKIPVLGKVPAGIPIAAIEDIIDWEEIPKSWTKGGIDFFALKIQGDSMEPEYRHGDVIIFARRTELINGADCVIMVNGDDATFKKVRKQDNGIALVPINPAYEPMFFSADDIQNLPVSILGIVKEIRRQPDFIKEG